MKFIKIEFADKSEGFFNVENINSLEKTKIGCYVTLCFQEDKEEYEITTDEYYKISEVLMSL